MKAFIRRHPVAVYYVLTFLVSWGGLFLAAGAEGIPGDPAQFGRRLPLVLLALLLGTTGSGLLLTGLVHGRAGLRDLLARLLVWRTALRWYAVALLTAPLLFVLVALALSPRFPQLWGIYAAAGDPLLLLMGLMGGLSAGIFEELGWTGFAIPELRRRHGVLGTGLIAGALWCVWHLPVNVWSSGSPGGGIDPALLIPSLIFSAALLPAFRVLMVWVYDHNESLLLAMLMHFSLTAGNVILVPRTVVGVVASAWFLGFAALLWLGVLTIALAESGSLPRQPVRMHAA